MFNVSICHSSPRVPRRLAWASTRAWALLFVVAASVSPVRAQPTGESEPTAPNAAAVRLLVLQDGPSPLLTRAADALRAEAAALFGPGSSVRVAVGAYTVASLGLALTDALAGDAAPDGVITLGPLSARAAIDRRLSTPTVAMLGAPLAAHGVDPSDPRPLLAAGSGLTFEGDLARLHELAPGRTRVAVPVTAAVAAALPGLADYLSQQGQAHGLVLTPHVLREGAGADPLADLQADALYLGLPLDPEHGGTRALLAAAAQHGLAVVAGLSDADVPRGALLSTLWPRQYRMWARAAVLALQSLLEGAPVASLRSPKHADAEDTDLERTAAATHSHRLVLNRRVVAQLGLSPTFALLRDAEQGDAAAFGQPLTLNEAVERALSANLELEAERQRVLGGAAQLQRARAPLLPQVGVGADATWIDRDRAATPFPPAERTVTLRGTVSQTLYSARKFGDHGVADDAQAARERSLQAAELDVVYGVAERYIELLRARDLERVMYKSVENARINLTLAEARYSAGEVGREELYRWRIALSSAQQGLVRATSRRRRAEVHLNEIQNIPAGTRLRPEEGPEQPLRMLATDARLSAYFERPDQLERLTAFAVEEARTAAPELSAAEAEVAAAERAHERALRALWLPDLWLQAGVAGRVWNDGAGANAQNTMSSFKPPDWLDLSVGVVASFPLFTGLSDQADVAEARAELLRARAEAEALSLALERRVRDALAEAGAAHQALSLAIEAADNAGRALLLMREAYARGAVDVLRLVDAQSQVVVTELAVENARHDFLAAFVQVERATGSFSFGPGARNPDAFLAALANQPAPARAPMEPRHVAP